MDTSRWKNRKKKNRRIRGVPYQETKAAAVFDPGGEEYPWTREHRDRTASTRQGRTAAARGILICVSLTKPPLGFSRVIYTRRSRVDRIRRSLGQLGPHASSWVAKKPRRFSFTRWANMHMQMLSRLGNFGGVFWA